MRKRFLLYIADLREGMIVAAVFPKGKSSVELQGNYREGQEIGLYERELPGGTYERLRRMMDDVGLHGLASSPPLPPETKTLSIGETVDGGATSQMKGYPLYAVPGVLSPLIDEMVANAEAILASPRRVLRGEGEPVKRELSLDKPLSFLITLKNVGSDTFTIQNPFRIEDSGFTGVRLFVAYDKPDEALSGSEYLYIDLKPGSLLPAAREGEGAPPRGMTLSLDPGSALQFIVKKRLLLSPGVYRARVSYHTSRGRLGAQALQGSLTVDLGSFVVAKVGRGTFNGSEQR